MLIWLDPVGAILLEHVTTIPTLADIRREELSKDDQVTLERTSYTVHNRINSLGVYHRDIRPENVFWDGKDQLKFIDFDLASFDDEDQRVDFSDECLKLDKGGLMSMLDDYGIPHKLGHAAPWFDKSMIFRN